MKRLCTSDWQLDANPRDRYRLDFASKTLPALIDKHKPDQLLILGDITEAKDTHPAPLVNEIVSIFHDLSKKCDIIILEGNHDYLHEGHPYFEFLNKLENIQWISKPTVLDNCLFLPHTRDYKKEWKGVDFNGHDFIFAHNIFDGVKANGQELSGIPTNIFPDEAFVISGDVHEPQELDNGKIVYVGSPCLCDFGDSYQPRVLLLEGQTAKSIKVYGQQKRLIQMYWPNDINLTYDYVNENDIVKINVHLRKEDVANWAAIRKQVEYWAHKNKFILNSIVPVVEAYVVNERQKLVGSQVKADNQYLSVFIKRSGIDEHTAQIGIQLIGD